MSFPVKVDTKLCEGLMSSASNGHELFVLVTPLVYSSFVFVAAYIITSAKEVMFSPGFVCPSVCLKFSGYV